MSKINKLEEELISIIDKIVNDIIKKNLKLNISAKSRAGAEISDYLEKSFEQTAKKITNKFIRIQPSPDGATKNPWDLKFQFKINSHLEEIWIDFKAIKISSVDSNPDIGTPKKLFDLIGDGFFYIVYVYVFYDEDGNGLKFEKKDNKYTKTYLLKDISKTFRRTPTNQLQVNASSIPEKRSRKEFLEILFKKIEESYKRQIEKSTKELKGIEDKKKDILYKNEINEKKIIDNL